LWEFFGAQTETSKEPWRLRTQSKLCSFDQRQQLAGAKKAADCRYVHLTDYSLMGINGRVTWEFHTGLLVL